MFGSPWFEVTVAVVRAFWPRYKRHVISAVAILFVFAAFLLLIVGKFWLGAAAWLPVFYIVYCRLRDVKNYGDKE